MIHALAENRNSCGNTIPAAHAASALLWCYGPAQDYGFDEREYAPHLMIARDATVNRKV